MSFSNAFNQALAGYGKSTKSRTSSNGVSSILSDFKPGQYAKVNADIATRAKSQPKQQQQNQQPAKPQPKPNFLSTVNKDAKGFASAATTGEQQFAKGIARVLPGGTADLSANVKQSDQAAKQAGQANKLLRQGKITKQQAIKQTKLATQNSDSAVKQQKTIEKSMPSKAQIALGAASTAADIATAGTFSRGKAGLTSEKLLKPLVAGTSKKAVAARGGSMLAANATAGGLNAAAGGGDKGNIIKNAAVGAAFPEILRGAAKVIGKGASKVAEKTGSAKEGKIDLQNTKVNTLLQTGHQYTPSNPKVKTLMEARAKQQESIDAPAKAAEQEKATVAKQAEQTQVQGQKIDRQIELIKAKGKDSETGLSNVDKTKLTHLQEDKQNLQSSTSVSETPTTQLPLESPKAQPKSTGESLPVEAKSTESVSSANSTPTESVSKTSGSALNAETKAVQKGLVTEFKDKAQYNSGSFKDEASKAVDLIKNDPQKAMDIATGKIPGDNTIHEVAVARALENKALQEADSETLRQLAQSPRHAVTSEAAQRLGAEGYGEKNSVVQNLAKIAKVRKDAFEKRTGRNATVAVSKEIKQIRETKPKVTPQSWSELVDSLKC